MESCLLNPPIVALKKESIVYKNFRARMSDEKMFTRNDCSRLRRWQTVQLRVVLGLDFNLN